MVLNAGYMLESQRMLLQTLNAPQPKPFKSESWVGGAQILVCLKNLQGQESLI